MGHQLTKGLNCIMFNVSADLKKRVEQRLAECVAKSGIDTGKITIKYDINSKRLGGQAIYSTNTIRLNPVFLNAHTEQYIFDTVAHEWAHLAAHKKYGRFISAHGTEWKNTMRSIGVPPERCHSYKVPDGIRVGKQVKKYAIVCNQCGASMACGAKVFSKLQAGATYRHNACGGRIAPVGAVNPVVPKPVVAPKVVAKSNGGATKLEKCTGIYLRNKQQLDRQRMIAAFVNDADCTPACASTYYAKLKKQYC